MSLCHLPTKNSFGSAEACVILNEDLNESGNDSYRSEFNDKEDLEAMQKLWDNETGFIHSKLTVVVTVNHDAVKMIMEGREENSTGLVELSRKMLKEEICTDLENLCRDGEIVKCHRAVLGTRSSVFQAMFQAEEMNEAKTRKLEMEEMSEQSVRAFLRWLYWNDKFGCGGGAAYRGG